MLFWRDEIGKARYIARLSSPIDGRQHTVSHPVECLPVGKFLSLYAYEGFEGVSTPTAVIIPLTKAWHEFVSFSGDRSQSGVLTQGDCGLSVTQAKTQNIRADWAVSQWLHRGWTSHQLHEGPTLGARQPRRT